MYSTHVSSSFGASAHSIRGIAVLRLRPLSMTVSFLPMLYP
jgi:hypothetical protein